MRASRDDTTEPSLYATLYDELKRVASRQLQGSGPCAGLCTTDLVHEAYLNLSDTPDASLENRAHFFAASARAMRQVLVDAARRAGAARRGSGEASRSQAVSPRSSFRWIFCPRRRADATA
jgi:RNA polymerase sigma factor (TIGR02999 family)